MERTLQNWHYSWWIMPSMFTFLTLLFDSAIDRAFVRKAFGPILQKCFSRGSVRDFQVVGSSNVFWLVSQCHELGLIEEIQMIVRKLEEILRDESDAELQLPKKILADYANYIVGPKPDSLENNWERDRLHALQSLKVLGAAAQAFLTSNRDRKEDIAA